MFGKARDALLEKLCSFVLLGISCFPNLDASVIRQLLLQGDEALGFQ